MPEEKEKSVQELTAQLLDELGTEALEQTGGDRWRAGQPLVNDPTTTEARKSEPPEAKPAETTPAAKPESKPQESTSPAEKKLFLDKYETEEEAKRGLHEAIQYATRSKDEADRLRAELEAVKRDGHPKAAEVPADPMDELVAWGLPKEPIAKALKQAARDELRGLLAPLVEQNKADEEIVKTYPDYKTKFPDIQRFLVENPEVEAIVRQVNEAGLYKLAREFAWLKFDRADKEKLQNTLVAQSEVDRQKIEQAKVDAKITGKSSSETRTRAAVKDEPISDERFERLKDLATAGHPSLLYRETIGRSLPKDFFPEE